jgi:hypothetical protein
MQGQGIRPDVHTQPVTAATNGSCWYQSTWSVILAAISHLSHNPLLLCITFLAVLGHADGLPGSLGDLPREASPSLPAATLTLEVPLQRLRTEADILKASFTPHTSVTSAQHQRSVSSPNLVPSPTVVWGGYVW